MTEKNIHSRLDKINQINVVSVDGGKLMYAKNEKKLGECDVCVYII